jgi:hypothetical protein
MSFFEAEDDVGGYARGERAWNRARSEKRAANNTADISASVYMRKFSDYIFKTRYTILGFYDRK